MPHGVASIQPQERTFATPFAMVQNGVAEASFAASPVPSGNQLAAWYFRKGRCRLTSFTQSGRSAMKKLLVTQLFESPSYQ